MSERTVKVTLVAQATGYVQGMSQAAQKTRELGTEAEKLAQKRQAFATLGRSMLAVGVAAAIGVGFAVSKFAEFDAAMSNVNAVTQETTANQQLLRDAALETGAVTVYTATESANAIEELAKAGLSTANILGGALTGSLDLAASGQLAVARAAEITGITLKQFQLDGSAAGRVADVLSAGANKAVGSVEDLAQGLKFVGPVTNSMNVSLEDTVATLALFADQGIIGEQAGTSLRGMLSSLTSPSSQAAKEMERLGITLYDNNGQFLGLENAAGQLKSTLGGLTQAERDMSLGILFGNQQITAARILVDSGAEAWRDYRNAVDDTGIASRIASERMNNLTGDLEKLGGAFDTALIQTGSGANDVLRSMVQSFTFLIDMVGGLPEPVLAAGLAVGVLVATVGLAGGAALVAVPKFATLQTSFQTLSVGGRIAAGAVGGITLAIGLATAIIGTYVARAAEAKGRTDALADSFDAATGSVTQYTRELIAKNLQDANAFEMAKKLGISQRELVDAILEGAEGIAYVTEAIERNNISQQDAAWISSDLARIIHDQSGELDAARGAWENTSAATDDTTGEVTEFGNASETARKQLSDLANEIRGFGSAQLDLREASRQVEQAIDDFSEAVTENGATFDITTEAGRENQDALDAIAEAYINKAAATYEATSSEEEAIGVLEQARAMFIAEAEAAGINADEAKRLADNLGLIPENVTTKIVADTDEADRRIQNTINLLLGLPSSVTVGVNSVLKPDVNALGGIYKGGVKAFASGGFASGIYPYTPGGIHKFAEEYDEAYVPLDPKRRPQSVDVLRESAAIINATPQELFGYQPAPVYRSAPIAASSLDGGLVSEVRQLVAELRGKSVVAQTVIDGRVLATSIRDFDNSLR